MFFFWRFCNIFFGKISCSHNWRETYMMKKEKVNNENGSLYHLQSEKFNFTQIKEEKKSIKKKKEIWWFFFFFLTNLRTIYGPSDFEHFKNTVLIFCIFRKKRQKTFCFFIFSNVRRSGIVIKINSHLIIVQWTSKISCKNLFFLRIFYIFVCSLIAEGTLTEKT